MKRSAVVVFVGSLAAILVMTAACSEDSGDKCCPVSESFVCENFLSGGARSLHADGQCPLGITDSIPRSRKEVDSIGCAVWVAIGPLTCGVAPPRDSGADVSADASAADVSVADSSGDGALDSDAGMDAATE